MLYLGSFEVGTIYQTLGWLVAFLPLWLWLLWSEDGVCLPLPCRLPIGFDLTDPRVLSHQPQNVSVAVHLPRFHMSISRNLDKSRLS